MIGSKVLVRFVKACPGPALSAEQHRNNFSAAPRSNPRHASMARLNGAPPFAQDLLAGMKTSPSRCNAAFRKASIDTRLALSCIAAIRICGLATALALIVASDICATGSNAQAAPTPLPPQRPTTLAPDQNAPPPSGQDLPQSNAPASRAPNAPPATADEPIRPGVINEGPGTLLQLPSASHARMHECAVKWQNMKTTGAAIEKTWFNFALKCLTR